MNKMFFVFLAAIVILPGCFGFFGKKEEPKIEQTSDTSAEEIAPVSDDVTENADEEASDSDSDEK